VSKKVKSKSSLLDLYVDYLISSFSYTTATGFSNLVDGEISHDAISRLLSKQKFGSSDLWQIAKPFVRQIESKDGVLILDDTIEEKPYTDENELVSWHYDHSKGRSVKGIQFISVLYYSREISIPVAFETIKKTEQIIKPDGTISKKSLVTKNEQYRDLLRQCKKNNIPFQYVLNDVWFASSENMMFIKHELEKDFVMPIKTNRKLALSKDAKSQGKYCPIESLSLEAGCLLEIYLEGVDFPLMLTKQVFTNEDGSYGILYLVTNDTKIFSEQITTIYKKRWKVEEYHKSLKSNVSLAKSPTQTVVTQTNHLFASLCAFIKLETLKMKISMNHFALKSKLYIKSLRIAYTELQNLYSLTNSI
jgi:hypothetical protein